MLRWLWVNRWNLPVILAFKIVNRAIMNDPAYAWGWHCNVAMASVDEGMEAVAANRAASRFMYNCFRVRTKEPQV